MQAYEHLMAAACGTNPTEARISSAAIHSQLDQPAFVAQLCTAASDSDQLPPAARQLALVVLKNAPLCRTDNRVASLLQESLPRLLRDPDVARFAALALAACIVEGDPEMWYPVFCGLLDPWQPTEPVLRCLSIIAQDAPADTKPALVPAATLVANSICDGDFGSQAAVVKLGFITVGAILSAVGVQSDSDFAAAVHRLFVQTSDTGLVTLGGQVNVDAMMSRDFELERECVRFFITVCHAIADEPVMPDMVRNLVERALDCLEGNLPAYTAFVLDTDDPHDDFAAYIGQLLDLLDEVLTGDVMGPVATAVLVDSRDWSSVVTLLLRYGVATPARLEEWQTSPNTYLKDDDDRAVAVSLQARDTALETILLVVRRRPEHLAGVLNECQALLSTLGVDESGWRLRESAICALDMLAARCRKEMMAQGHNDIGALLKGIFDTDLMGDGPPTLQCRALCLFGTVMHKSKSFLTADATEELAQLLLPACASTLSGGTAPLLSVVSCRTLRPLLTRASCDCMAANSPSVPFAVLGFLSSPFATEEVLYCALETLQTWADKVPLLAPSGLDNAPEIVCACWKNNLIDPNVGELVVDVFRKLTSRHPSCEASLLMCLPWLGEVLRGCEDPGTMCIIPYILEIIERVLRAGSGTSAAAAYGDLLTPLCSLVLSNEDSGIVGTALKCVAAVVVRAGVDAASRLQAEILPSALAYPPALPGLDEVPEYAPLSDVVASVLQTVLNPDRRENTLMGSGRSLERLLHLLLHMQHHRAPDILQLLVHRATLLKTDSVLQQVLFPLTAAFKENPETTLRLLGDSTEQLMSLLLSRVQYFDGLPLTNAVDVLIGCLDHAADLGLEEASVSGLVPRQSIPFPVGAFVALSRVLLALNDGEIHSSDDEDDDDENGPVAKTDEAEDGWSSEDSGDDDLDTTAAHASSEDVMGTPASTNTSYTTSPTTNAPRPPKLRDRVGACLSRWVQQWGPAASQYLTARHVAKLQKLWVRYGN